MQQHRETPFQLKTRASDARCAHCPPERVCAWSCVQGMNNADIVTGAALEQSQTWALEHGEAPDMQAAQQALWELYNG